MKDFFPEKRTAGERKTGKKLEQGRPSTNRAMMGNEEACYEHS